METFQGVGIVAPTEEGACVWRGKGALSEHAGSASLQGKDESLDSRAQYRWRPEAWITSILQINGCERRVTADVVADVRLVRAGGSLQLYDSLQRRWAFAEMGTCLH